MGDEGSWMFRGARACVTYKSQQKKIHFGVLVPRRKESNNGYFPEQFMRIWQAFCNMPSAMKRVSASRCEHFSIR